MLPRSDRDPARTELADRLASVHHELHEGLEPALAGIRLGLQGARNLLTLDPAASGELLAHLQAEVDLAVEAARRLSLLLVGTARE